VTALAVPLIGTQPALAAVPTGKATINAPTVAGNDVTVTWEIGTVSYDAGTATANTWTVSVAGQNGATANSGTCTSGIAEGTRTCTFTANGAGGTYRITVTPYDGAEAGTASDPLDVVVAKPSDTVASLNAVADESTVTATWSLAGVTEAEWGTTTGRDIEIAVTGGSVDDSTCVTAPVNSAQASCVFTAIASEPTTYTVSVNLTNSTGDGAVVTDSVLVSTPASAPVGTADDLNAIVDGGTVNLTWDPTGVTNWGTGTEPGFKVDVEKAGGGGGVADDSDCGIDTSGASTETLPKTTAGCSFIPTVAGTYTITVTPTSSVDDGDPATDAVVVSAIAPTGTLAPVTATATGDDVEVQWDATDVTGETLYDVTVEPSTIASGATCKAGIATEDDNDQRCTFTATAADTYTVTVTPRNTTGSGVAVSAEVDVDTPPTSTALGLALVATADGAQINVVWDKDGVTDWGLGTNPGFKVAITGGTVGANDCGVNAAGTSTERLPTTAEGCSFTATADDTTYTITLTPQNTDVDDHDADGTAATDTAASTEAAPAVTENDLEPSHSEPSDNGVITVSWNAIPDGNWGSGDERAIDVVVNPASSGSGASASAGACTTDMPEDTTECTFTPTQSGTYTVTLTPKTEMGSGAPVTLEVEVDATGPAGAVTLSEPTVAGSMVTVVWDASGVDWGTGGSQVFKVEITGGEFDPGTCSATLDSSATTCRFTAMEAAIYTITVTPANSEGDGDAADVEAEVSVAAQTARDGAGKLHLFARWSDGSVKTAMQDGTGAWGAWVSLDGRIVGEPVVFRNANGQLHLLVIGLDGAIWQRQQTATGGTSYSSWSSLGGVVRSIAVETDASGKAVVVSRAPDNSVWLNSQAAANGTSWSGWAGLGGGVISDPALTVSGSSVEVRARGLDGEFWHRTLTGTTWSDWAQVGDSSSAMAA
jgi:hypothetical protein